MPSKIAPYSGSSSSDSSATVQVHGFVVMKDSLVYHIQNTFHFVMTRYPEIFNWNSTIVYWSIHNRRLIFEHSLIGFILVFLCEIHKEINPASEVALDLFPGFGLTHLVDGVLPGKQPVGNPVAIWIRPRRLGRKYLDIYMSVHVAPKHLSYQRRDE